MPGDVQRWGMGEGAGLGSEVRSPSVWGTFNKAPSQSSHPERSRSCPPERHGQTGPLDAVCRF